MDRRILIILIILTINISIILRNDARESGFPKDPAILPTEYSLKNGLKIISLQKSSQVAMENILFAVNCNNTGNSFLCQLIANILLNGSETIGTSDYKKEVEISDRIRCLRNKILLSGQSQSKDTEIKLALDEINYLEDKLSEIINPLEARSLISQNGGSIKLSFHNNYALFNITLPAERIEAGFKLLSELLTHPAFRNTYETLLYLIHKNGYEYPTNEILYEIYNNTTPLFFKQNYIPNNMTLIASGILPNKIITDLSESYFAQLKNYNITKILSSDISLKKSHNNISEKRTSFFYTIPSAELNYNELLEVEVFFNSQISLYNSPLTNILAEKQLCNKAKLHYDCESKDIIIELTPYNLDDSSSKEKSIKEINTYFNTLTPSSINNTLIENTKIYLISKYYSGLENSATLNRKIFYYYIYSSLNSFTSRPSRIWNLSNEKIKNYSKVIKNMLAKKSSVK